MKDPVVTARLMKNDVSAILASLRILKLDVADFGSTPSSSSSLLRNGGESQNGYSKISAKSEEGE